MKMSVRDHAHFFVKKIDRTYYMAYIINTNNII